MVLLMKLKSERDYIDSFQKIPNQYKRARKKATVIEKENYLQEIGFRGYYL
jgi:hypothetical protein